MKKTTVLQLVIFIMFMALNSNAQNDNGTKEKRDRTAKEYRESVKREHDNEATAGKARREAEESGKKREEKENKKTSKDVDNSDGKRKAKVAY